ncbi:MAG: hypothetical protein BA863_02460 [Desulfovibrio sp. S3730MH75]|nr:MAG: hypothetical protein BA863_02460 [Desulfovibrio sp. S3730MH75]
MIKKIIIICFLISVTNQNVMAKKATVSNVKANYKRYIAWSVPFEGTISKGNYYYNDALRQKFECFEIYDGTGTAYAYLKKYKAKSLEKNLREHGGRRKGSFHTRIPRKYCSEKYRYLCTELEGWNFRTVTKVTSRRRK